MPDVMVNVRVYVILDVMLDDMVTVLHYVIVDVMLDVTLRQV